jgi:hypothetical protein
MLLLMVLNTVCIVIFCLAYLKVIKLLVCTSKKNCTNLPDFSGSAWCSSPHMIHILLVKPLTTKHILYVGQTFNFFHLQ